MPENFGAGVHGALRRIVVNKRYELSNHLGNVLSVITDRKLIGGNQTETLYTKTKLERAKKKP
jgi:hypothetical protein